MSEDYWLKQSVDKPLFPDLLWSRPENKSNAGKLLVVGGHAESFAATADSFAEAMRAGIGGVRVLLPNSLAKTVGKVFPEAEFAASSRSGSFSQEALAELLTASSWADGVLLAGDFGRNSETAVLLEKFTQQYKGQLTISNDSVDYFMNSPDVLERDGTTLALSFIQLQKLATAAKFNTAFSSGMDLLRIVEALHELTKIRGANIVTNHLDTFFVAVNGQVSTTKVAKAGGNWQTKAAANTAVWWLQNADKTFESLTTALYLR